MTHSGSILPQGCETKYTEVSAKVAVDFDGLWTGSIACEAYSLTLSSLSQLCKDSLSLEEL